MRLVILALLLCANLFAQDLKLIECNKNTYPDVELTLQRRDPNFIDVKELKISENNKDLSNFELIPEKRNQNYKRAVLILFENSNPVMFNAQREYFKSILLNSLGESFTAQDILYFSEFDWTDKNGKAVPKEKIKKGTAAEISGIVSEIITPPSNGNQLSLAGQTCYSRALRDGLEFLAFEKLDTSYCKSILLLSGAFDDYNGKISTGDIILSARKNNVAIYTMDYPRMAGKYDTKDIAYESYGVYTKAESNNTDKYTDSLKTIFKNMSLMASGSFYTLKYKTEVGPGNVAVNLKFSLKSGNQTDTINYNTPSYVEWIFSSPIRILILVLIVAVLIGLPILFIIRNRKKQKRNKAETDKKLAEIEENNRRSEEESKRMLLEQEEKFKKENEDQRLRQQREKEMQQRKDKDNESLGRLNSRNRIPTLVDMSGNVYNLAALVTKIGRIEGNDLLIDDKTVSKNHAVIMYERQSPEDIPVPCNEFFILDLGSSNGTLVNNLPVIGAQKLKDGDIIRFGNISASFRS
jgi:hypothetical protein